MTNTGATPEPEPRGKILFRGVPFLFQYGYNLRGSLGSMEYALDAQLYLNTIHS
jgi:hypothetical protein